MNRAFVRLSLVAAAVALSGCSSFKLGGFCYLPAGQSGGCTVNASVPEQAAVERYRE